MKFVSGWTLQRKIGLFVVLGLMLGVGTFGFLSLQALRQSTQTMLQERLTVAQMVADYTDEVLGRAMAELENTAETLSNLRDPSQVDVAMDTLHGVYSRSGIFTHDIVLVDAAGQVVWSKAHGTRPEGLSMATYPSIMSTVTGQTSTTSGLVSASEAQNPLVLLAAPVSGGVADGPGALVAAIDPARSVISAFIQPIKLGKTGYAEIVDQQGLVIARTQPGRPLAPFEQSDHPERFVALISEGKATVRTCHSCHVTAEQTQRSRDVLAFAPLSTARWGVAIRQSEAEALAATDDLRRRLLASGGLLIVITLGVVLLSTRDMVARIKRLKAASQRMAGGDLTSAVPPQGGDEIGALAETLDTMRLQLKTSYGQLERRTKELASLLAISRARTSAVSLDTILKSALDKLVEVVEAADAAVLMHYEPEQEAFALRSYSGPEPAPAPDSAQATAGPRRADLLAGLVCTGPTSSQVQALSRRGCEAFHDSYWWSQPSRASLCAPVVAKWRFLGVLLLLSGRGDAPSMSKGGASFSDSDKHIAQAVADEVALVMENAELAKDAEQALAWREADRLKSEFIANVSHELRTPLTSIKGCSTSLLRPDVTWDEKTVRDFLHIIDERADDLRDLIDKLLHMAGMEAGRIKPEKEPVLVTHLARKVVDEIKRKSRKHKFVVDFTAPFPVIEADSRYTELVLRNLVENAVKYSPRGGKVTVQGRVQGQRIVVSVSDEGVGIPAQHISKVFDRFYRVYNAETKETGGSGLGLSIAKGLLEAQGGNIWVESTPGHGSTFYLSLPLETAATIEEPAEAPDAASSPNT